MTDKLVVLVLGVGGNVSQGILKALALSSLPCRVIGACVSPMAFGLYTVDRAYVSPRANDPVFLDWLISTCRKEGVQAVLSGVEPVLAVLARRVEAIRRETGAICIVSSPECLAIGDDKLLTARWLAEQGFNAPRSAAHDDAALQALAAECGYPLVAKPRGGKGAQGLLEVRNAKELALAAGREDYVVQEWLGDPDCEYTVGCFSDSQGAVRGSIVMRRGLSAGTTVWAQVGEFPEVRAEAIRIAEALRPMGPCNMQLRLHRARPVCFEINIRFSGTTPLRARFGFNEVEAALRHYVLREPAIDLPLVTTGVALRYWNELYVAPEAYRRLEQFGYLEEPAAYPGRLEDYGWRP